MAIYKQVQERMLQPYHYLSSNGMEAKHDTPEEDLAKDSLGSLSVAYGELEKRNDRLIYTEASDLDLMSEVEQDKAFYAFDEASVNRMLRLNAIAEVDRDSAPSEEEEAAPEPAINASPQARKEAEKRGVDLRNVEGTGNGGQITLNDVKAVQDHPRDDGIRTWEED
jgi:pyruvate/2-oxoglutarate dehydrogenase complex dihydrolipoamide acyltransferase (E2) component